MNLKYKFKRHAIAFIVFWPVLLAIFNIFLIFHKFEYSSSLSKWIFWNHLTHFKPAFMGKSLSAYVVGLETNYDVPLGMKV
jgi:hypothetical protein